MEFDNLNKQNFFTEEWKNKYPNAAKLFCSWIDKYKEKVEWKKLFASWICPDDFVMEIKFHDIPLEMQVGIIHKFSCERGEVPYYFFSMLVSYDLDLVDVKLQLDKLFDRTEKDIVDSKNENAK